MLINASIVSFLPLPLCCDLVTSATDHREARMTWYHGEAPV